MNKPHLKTEYSGRTSAYEHKHNFDPSTQLSESTDKGLRKVWFLDAQWSTCPVEVEEQVKKLWRAYDCGNDNYIVKSNVEDLLESGEKYAAIVQYIREHGIPDDEQVIIHWWW